MTKSTLLKCVLAGLMVAVFLPSFWPVLQKLANSWGNDDNSYGYLIVPLFFYLCWEKRKTFRFDRFSWNMWGLVPVIMSVLLIVAGELGSVVTLMFIGIWGCIAGVMFVLYGLRLRQLAFPLLILLFMVPMPPYINRILTFNLKMSASTLSVEMMRMTGMTVFQEGNIIDLGITQLQVVDACSGLRYLLPLLLLALIVGHFYSRGWWRKGVLIMLVVPLSVVLNALRIWLTGILTVNGHAKLAESFFHDFSGWVIFMVAAVLLYFAHLLLKRVGPDVREKPKTDPGAGTSGYLKPVLLTVFIFLIFAAAGTVLQKIPSAHKVPERSSFDEFPMIIGHWEGKRNYLAPEIMDQLWADDYVSAVFRNRELPNSIYVLIPFYEYQATRHTAHAPQSCLLGGGWTIINSGDRTMNVGKENNIVVRTMLMQKGDSRMLASYFFFQRGRVITSPWLNKAYLMLDAVTRRRTDGALVRVETAIAPGQSKDQAFMVLENFISGLWKIMPTYVPL